MVHHTAQILSCQEYEVVVIARHLLLDDAGLARHQVKQLVSLLPRALVLILIFLDQLRKL